MINPQAALITRRAVPLFPGSQKASGPREHLKSFRGILQADGYAGFQGLYDRQHEPLVEAACMAHARRKFFDLHAATASPVALEALERIGALYQIETRSAANPPMSAKPPARRALRRC